MLTHFMLFQHVMIYLQHGPKKIVICCEIIYKDAATQIVKHVARAECVHVMPVLLIQHGWHNLDTKWKDKKYRRLQNRLLYVGNVTEFF